jgi:2-C-methyl-D-erythritol 4-phosphate cytidylyltransferase
MNQTAGIWAIIPAAGSGTRMGTSLPKQYLSLHNETVIAITVKRLASFPAVNGIYVGIASDDSRWATIKYQLGHLPVPFETFIGGESRAQTVLNGINALADKAHDGDWVLVHDAARPCVRHDDIRKLVNEAGETDDGGILALPVADTVKRTDDRDRISKTISRENLWRALTPQYFPIGDLKKALTQALDEEAEITDEASAMEYIGATPRCVAGHADNIKITYPADLELAEMYLRKQKKEANT